jgi:diguanylate cyclase (GGDEF)-like protein
MVEHARLFEQWLSEANGAEAPTVGYEHVQFEAGELADEAVGEAAARLRALRGAAYYSDLVFLLSCRRLPAERARAFWVGMLAHRDQLKTVLGRNPGIAVAALDYLANFSTELYRPVFLEQDCLHQVMRHATHDGLSGLYDHHSLEVLLEQLVSQPSAALAVVMIDLDRFKLFNDERGHPAGDRVIARVGDLLARHVRSSDIAARYGGEEFCVVLRDQSALDALHVAERLRAAIEAELASEGVTASLGVASYPEQVDDPALLIASADAALYEAKRGGRNQVRAHRRSAAKVPAVEADDGLEVLSVRDSELFEIAQA